MEHPAQLSGEPPIVKKRKLVPAHDYCSDPGNACIIFELVETSKEEKVRIDRYLVPLQRLSEENLKLLVLIDGRNNRRLKRMLLRSTLSEETALNQLLSDWCAAEYRLITWSAGEVPVVGFYTYHRKY